MFLERGFRLGQIFRHQGLDLFEYDHFFRRNAGFNFRIYPIVSNKLLLKIRVIPYFQPRLICRGTFCSLSRKPGALCEARQD